jgi:Protein of unknown function (DUF2934)
MDKEIADLAYRYWEQRGRPVGSPDIDWHSAAHDVDRERMRHELALDKLQIRHAWTPDAVQRIARRLSVL